MRVLLLLAIVVPTVFAAKFEPFFIFWGHKEKLMDTLFPSVMRAYDAILWDIPFPTTLWNPSPEQLSQISTSSPVFLFGRFSSANETASALPLEQLKDHTVMVMTDYSVGLEQPGYPNLRGLFKNEIRSIKGFPMKRLEVLLNLLVFSVYKNDEPLSAFVDTVDVARGTDSDSLDKIWRQNRLDTRVTKASPTLNEQHCPTFRVRSDYRNALVDDIEDGDTPLLWEQKTDAQIFNHTSTMGLVIVRDGSIKLTQNDEFVYREMFVHVPMIGSGLLATNSPKPIGISVLIIGGADGGVLREVLKYNQVESVVIVEENKELMRQCIKWLKVQGNYSDPRVRIVHPKRMVGMFRQEKVIHDALGRHMPFDFIFLDVQEPGDLSPAAIGDSIYFYSKKFFTFAKSLLSEQGCFVVSADSPDFFPSTLHKVFNRAKSAFHSEPEVFHVSIPFHGGHGAFVVARTGGESISVPAEFSPNIVGKQYDRHSHVASFFLPTFWLEILENGKSSVDVCENREDYMVYPAVLQVLAELHNTTVAASVNLNDDERMMLKKRTQFQEMEIRWSPFWGRYLLLDDIEQCTQRDEYAYHEMFAHIPLEGSKALVREGGARVLIIGGGDGGLLKEVLRHRAVSKVVMMEIDDVVVQSCKEYFKINGNYDDPRVTLNIGDAFKFIADAKAAGDLGPKFDVVLVDINDPGDEEVPAHQTAEALYSAEFYQSIKDGVMVPGSVLVTHAECPLFVPWAMRRVSRDMRSVFGNLQAYRYTVPAFRGGEHVYLASTYLPAEEELKIKEQMNKTDSNSNNVNATLARLLQLPNDITFEGKLYNARYHQSAFMLPPYWKEILYTNDTIELPTLKFGANSDEDDDEDDDEDIVKGNVTDVNNNNNSNNNNSINGTIATVEVDDDDDDDDDEPEVGENNNNNSTTATATVTPPTIEAEATRTETKKEKKSRLASKETIHKDGIVSEFLLGDDDDDEDDDEEEEEADPQQQQEKKKYSPKELHVRKRHTDTTNTTTTTATTKDEL